MCAIYQNSKQTLEHEWFLFSCLWWRNPLDHMWFVSSWVYMHSSLLRSHNFPRGRVSKVFVDIITQASSSSLLWTVLCLWILKDKTTDDRIIKPVLPCEKKEDDIRDDIWWKYTKVGTANLMVGLGKTEVMWVVKCLVLSFLLLSSLQVEWKKLKKEYRGRVWALTVGGFSIMYEGRWACTSLRTSQRSPVSCLWLWALTHSVRLVG